jgi:hypothetical protein
MAMAEAPDVIVLGGDYVTWGDRDYVRAAAEALGPLSAPFGVFGILGNHDDDHDMPAALAARGVQMLKDARTTVGVKGEAVDFVGIRYWTKRGSLASIVRGATGFPFYWRTILGCSVWPLVTASVWCFPVTPMAVRACCRESAPLRNRSSRCLPAPHGATRRRYS